MLNFEFIKANYLKLRGELIKYLEKFDQAYFFQPTEKSNTVAWIVPHIVAFEKVMITDKIEGYNFPFYISQENVDKYKPGVNGFNLKKTDLLSKEKAIALLKKSEEVLVKFLDDVINKSNEVQNVDREEVFSRFMLSYSHETEHFGQLKYLLGTYQRLTKKLLFSFTL